MKFHIPFTISRIQRLKQRSHLVSLWISRKRHSKLEEYLITADVPLTREEYLGTSFISFAITFIIVYLLATTALVITNTSNTFVLGLGIAALAGLFIMFSQLVYPKVYASRRQKNIEKNVIPALEDMLVQLNAGVPLFNILVNISSSDYNELSVEFKKAVKEINAGRPQVEVLDELGKKNSSQYFRRALWQISNGMKAGSDISIVVKETMKSLNEEQYIQIQNYGNKLNPLIVFYMLISIILPALSITFLTVISSLINLSKTVTISMFVGIFFLVVMVQISFIGMMKSIRPSLL